MSFGKPLSEKFKRRITLDTVKDALQGFFAVWFPVHKKSKESNPAKSCNLQVLIRMRELYLI